ncbi:MAG: magnesium/cobalt transporter CorA [Alphaproteobacteria bacterium]|nr:magnesium/cobalt transporter CorA [Alphaproteobacteria bacterium]
MASALRRTFRRRRVTPGSYKPNPGSSPGVLTVSPLSHPSQVFVIAYGPEGYIEHACRELEEISRFVGAWPVVWVNVIGLGSIETIEKIGTMFGVDRLLLEDVLDTTHRPKTEHYEHHLFTIIKGGLHGDQFESEHISIFLKKNVVIVFEERPGSSFSQVRERIRRGTGKIRSHGTDYLYYALLDEVIDKYFPILDKLNQNLATVEDEIMTRSRHIRDRDVINQIHHTKSDLLLLHKTIWPISDMVNLLMREETPLLTKGVRGYLRDCYDHSVQANELTQFYRDTASGLLNTYLAYEGHKTNEIVKVLTLISAIFIPLTFVAGVYGMNFDNIPELHSPYGYPAVMGAMFAMATGMVIFFKRRGWLDSFFPPKAPPGSEYKQQG